MNNDKIMPSNDFYNDFKEQQKEMNKTELIVNNIKSEIEDADDEPIYAVSDFEGRFDYYIRFFTDIGFLDKQKLYDTVEREIKNSDKQEEEKNKELEMLKILFTESPEEWFKKIIQHFKFCGIDMRLNKLGTDNVYKTNIERLNFLKTYFTEDVLKSAINENFKGKIVINGDLYSSRVNDLFGEEKKEIVLINKLCFNLFDAIKKDNNVKDHLILVAGNHDVYHMDYADGQYYNSRYDDILKNIKNSTLPFLTKWFKVKTKDDKMLIFKHSPYLLEVKGVSTDLSEIINNEKNCQEVGITNIIKYCEDEINNPNSCRHTQQYYFDNNKNSHHTWQYYFYNGFHEPNTFHSNSDINNDVKKILARNNAKLVVGHCHAGGKIKDGCICIDDNGKYKYRVFHFVKKKDISNDKNNVYDECNSLNSTQEDIYFDDIQYEIVPSKPANNLGHNNNNISFQYRYIKQENPNINNGKLKSILQDNRKKLPKDFDEENFQKLFNDVHNYKNNPKPAQEKVHNQYDNNVNNVNYSANKGSDDGHCGNPIFKIMDHVDNDSGQQDGNNNTEQKKQDNKQDIPLYTFGSTNTETFNQQQQQNKEVSCEMVKNCLSSMCGCLNCKRS